MSCQDFFFSSLTVTLMSSCHLAALWNQSVITFFSAAAYVNTVLISIMSNAKNLQCPPDYDVLNEPRLMSVHKTIAGHKGIMLAQW